MIGSHAHVMRQIAGYEFWQCAIMAQYRGVDAILQCVLGAIDMEEVEAVLNHQTSQNNLSTM